MDAPAGQRLERRKQLRVCVRRDLQVTPQRYEGRPHYVVKDPISLRYWRFQEREYFLFERLDGRRTLDDIRGEYEKHFRPERLRLEDVETFARQLVEAGVAQPTAAAPGEQVLQRRRRANRTNLLALSQQVLAFQVPLFDPDRLLGRMVPWLGWLCTRIFFACSIGLVLAALLLVGTHFDEFLGRLPAAHAFFTWRSALYLWVAMALVKIVHEFGHGLSCKALGGEVHEMGLLVLCFTPCLYCNVTDAWRLPSKWQRMAISFAGIHVELLIAALAAFMWWHASPGTLVHNLSLSLMMVCGVNTALLNGNPLMRYDGYHVLADWIEVPNLRERAAGLWQRWFLRHGLGIDVPPAPTTAPWRRGLLAAYGVGSLIYRWVVTFSMLWFLSQFLTPLKLGSIAVVLGVSMVAMGVFGPISSFVRGLTQNGRLPAMKMGRVGWSAGLAAAGLTVFFLAPLPVSGIRQQGLVEVRPEAVERVFAPTNAVLERLHVRAGQRVEAGELLVDLRNLDLEHGHAEAAAEVEIQAVRVQTLREMASATFEGKERARLEATLTSAVGDRARAARQVELLTQQRQKLQVRAPRAGIVMSVPRVDALGKLWEKDAGVPLCTIGDPGRLWVQMPLGPADFRRLQEELAARGQLPVRVRVPGRQAATWAAAVAQWPESETKEIPLALAEPAGGPVAVKQGAPGQGPAPVSQQYLVAFTLTDPDAAIVPGGLATVSVRCRWRSAAWWVWQKVTGTFDVPLI